MCVGCAKKAVCVARAAGLTGLQWLSEDPDAAWLPDVRQLAAWHRLLTNALAVSPLGSSREAGGWLRSGTTADTAVTAAWACCVGAAS